MSLVLTENTDIPSHMQKEALTLEGKLDWDDEGGDGVTSSVDDEYRWAGVKDPKVMITTSREPSSRLKIFAKVSKQEEVTVSMKMSQTF